MDNKPEDILDKIKKLANGDSESSLNEAFDLDEKIEELNMGMYKKSESQRLELRAKLTNAIKHIIWFQLLFFNIVVGVIVSSVTLKFSVFREIDTELAIQLFEFLKYYISATIVELLGMLGFILHYVFSGIKPLEPGKRKNGK